jgi:hypothetical protein
MKGKKMLENYILLAVGLLAVSVVFAVAGGLHALYQRHQDKKHRHMMRYVLSL